MQKTTGNNPKLGLVNVDVHTKFGQILSIRSQDIEWKPHIHGITESRNNGITDSRKDGMTEGQGESSIAPLFQSGAIIKGRNSVKILRKMTGNNPKLDLVNDDVHTKFGPILSICSQHIERKRNSDVNQGP